MDIVYPEPHWDSDIGIRSGRSLPHWVREGAVYHVIFRLFDSLPQSKLKEWEEERKHITDTALLENRKLSQEEKKELSFLQSEKVEQYLDAGHGACWLKKDPIAEIVAESIWHFDEERYNLSAWCIMPNHVHVIVQPLTGWELDKIAHTWKSFTANRANECLKRNGTFWQKESFDHLIRDPDNLERTIEYVWKNPENAGIENWPWRWKIGMKKPSSRRLAAGTKDHTTSAG